jgi:hypothetical protein
MAFFCLSDDIVKPVTVMFMMLPVFMILLIITEKLVIMNSIAGTFL